MEGDKAKHVHIIGVIYIEPLALCEPIVEDIRICEQEHKSWELKEELKTILNFLRWTITFTVTVELRIIGISNSNLEFEIIPQLVGKEQSSQALELELVEK